MHLVLFASYCVINAQNIRLLQVCLQILWADNRNCVKTTRRDTLSAGGNVCVYGMCECGTDIRCTRRLVRRPNQTAD